MPNLVKDVMTPAAITVREDTPLADAVNMLNLYSFNGLPVVDGSGRLVGLLTERDLILNDSYVHLKTLLKLFGEFDFYRKDAGDIKEELKTVLNLKVSGVMNAHPQTIRPTDSIDLAAGLLAEPRNNPLPVVDDSGRLVGVMALADLTKFYGVSLRSDRRAVDQNVDKFLQEFERKFILVSKFRTSTWLITSLIFAVVGFVVAFMFMLRITV